MSDFQPTQPIVEEFKEVFGTTGLVNGDFTKELTKDGANSAIAVTVTNISGDRYSVSYTPDSVGVWTARVWRTALATVKYSQSRKVQTKIENQVWDALISAHTTASSFAERLVLAYKWLRNRIVKSSAASGTYTLYDDDETTPIGTGTFSTVERNPD